MTDPAPLTGDGFFSYRMDVKNDGIFPVYGVRCGLGIRHLKPEPGYGAGIFGSEDFGFQMIARPDVIGTLRPGEAYTFSAENVFGGHAKVQSADFAVVISYVPLLLPVRRAVCVHFVSHADAAGVQHWFRSSSGKCKQPDWFDYKDLSVFPPSASR